MPRTRAQRAQQFQAYDALKGFTELLQIVKTKIALKDILHIEIP